MTMRCLLTIIGATAVQLLVGFVDSMRHPAFTANRLSEVFDTSEPAKYRLKTLCQLHAVGNSILSLSTCLVTHRLLTFYELLLM